MRTLPVAQEHRGLKTAAPSSPKLNRGHPWDDVSDIENRVDLSGFACKISADKSD